MFCHCFFLCVLLNTKGVSAENMNFTSYLLALPQQKTLFYIIFASLTSASTFSLEALSFSYCDVSMVISVLRLLTCRLLVMLVLVKALHEINLIAF
jgi:hypothetical protein